MAKPIIKIGKIFKANDKIFGGPKKPRNVVVSKHNKNKNLYGVSRILSIEGKISKKDTLLPIRNHDYFEKPSGVDYGVYFYTRDKNGNKIPLNFGSMVDVEVYLDEDEIVALQNHIKSRGGKDRNFKIFIKK